MVSARRSVCVVAIVLLAVTLLLAITTVPVKKKCPICGTENEFYTYASWGSYVYHWDTKYQLVFWPHTYSATHYSCKRCHFSVYMWDWDEFPKDKVEAVRKALEGVTVSGKSDKYTQIPVSEKMVIAEKVYKVLGKDDAFWEQFYRVLGFHFDAEHKPTQAMEARRHALELTEKRLASAELKGERKQALVAAAAMHHFVHEDEIALKQLDEAERLKYVGAKGEEESKGFDGYLSELIKDYKEKIKAGRVPTGHADE